jgi:hypothetical protein
MLTANIDGGGIRGYASLLILERLMDSIREIEVAHPEGDHCSDLKRPEKLFSREKLAHSEPCKKARKLSEEAMCILIKQKLQKATSQEKDFCWRKASKPSSVGFSDAASFYTDTVDGTASSASTSASYTMSRGMSSQSSATEWTNQDDVTLLGLGVNNKAAFPEQRDNFLPSDYFDTIVGTSTGG